MFKAFAPIGTKAFFLKFFLMRKLILPCAIAGFCLLSCIDQKAEIADLSLKTDSDAITATAEFITGSDSNQKMVKVVSNRSWSAHLNDIDNPVKTDESVPWASLDVCEHLNLTNVSDEVVITVTFNRNYSQSKINGVLDLFSEGRIFLSIPVTQDGAVYHLQASPDKTDANCDRDTVRISVDCNTAWTAEVVDATANVSLGMTEGFDPDVLPVSFEENFDIKEKSARIKISAKDCEDIFINLSQDEAKPYLKLAPSNVYLLPGGEVSGKIIIQTNCAWTASLKSSTLSDIILKKTSGEAGISGDQEIDFTFTNPGGDPKSFLNAVFSIKAESMELNPEYRQRCPLVMDLLADIWEPKLSTSFSTEETSHSMTVGDSSYQLKLLYFYKKGSNYFLVRGNYGDSYGYLITPAIEDLTLKKIVLEKVKNSSYYIIEAKVVDPATEKTLANKLRNATDKAGELVTWNLGETGVEPQPGTSYKLLSTTKSNGAISKVILYYE